MKRIIMAMLIALTLSVVSFADVNIAIDGQKIVWDETSGTPFVDEANRTQVPFRQAMETFGAVVGWESESTTAIATKDGVEVRVPIGEYYLLKDGVKIGTDTTAIIKDGRTYLPIRAVLEAFDATIKWDSEINTVVVTSLYADNKIIKVDGGNLSGNRAENAKVDIGYGDRQYWAYTNEYGQLVKVTADHITLQDEANEKVNSDGRYFDDEAKVPGTESPSLDEGHVIADSLGGVSNAYNITPEDSDLNRHGDQAYMEKVIRDVLKSGGTCTDFVATITYPNTETQIPIKYHFEYKLNGELIIDNFDNADPENTMRTSAASTSTAQNDDTDNIAAKGNVIYSDVQIVKLDKKDEYIIIKNTGKSDIDLKGWTIVSVRGDQRYTFDNYILAPGQSVIVGDSARTKVDLHWLDGGGTWNNKKKDPAELYDANGNLVSEYGK